MVLRGHDRECAAAIWCNNLSSALVFDHRKSKARPMSSVSITLANPEPLLGPLPRPRAGYLAACKISGNPKALAAGCLHLDWAARGYAYAKKYPLEPPPDKALGSSQSWRVWLQRLRSREGTVAAPLGGDAVVAGTVVSAPLSGDSVGATRRRSFRCPRASNTSARRKWDRTTGREHLRTSPVTPTDAVVDVFALDRSLFDAANAAKRRVHVCNGNPGTLTVEESVCVKGLSRTVYRLVPLSRFSPCFPLPSLGNICVPHKDMDWPPWAEHG